MAKSNTISVTAVPGQHISVGINYPWAWDKYGCFFGSGEVSPGDTPAYDTWLPNLDRNLGTIEDCVSVVRIFLLCNFNNLGTTKTPGQGPLVLGSNFQSTTYSPVLPWTNFVPPAAVSPIYADQLDKLLKIFNKHEIKVILCLTDFGAFAQGPKSACRTDIITDPAMQSWFLQNVIDPLLAVCVSGDNAKAIFAVEVMNEPGQVTKSSASWFLTKTNYPIPAFEMNAFLRDVISRIKARGLKSTVGHHYAGDLSLPTGDFPQFHYYPQHFDGFFDSVKNLFVPYNLPPFSETKAFIGEFQGAYTQKGQDTNVAWPELPDAVQKGDVSRIAARLQLIEAKGYGLALVWPDDSITFDPANPSNEPLHVSKGVLDGIRQYLK